MGVLDTTVDHRTHAYREARSAMLAALAQLEAALDAAREGGGERAVTRHHARGRLLPRERIELLVDRDSPVLELCPVAGWGTGAPIGAAVVIAIGVIESRPCVLTADDPTVPAAAAGGATLRKVRRAQQIALENRLPFISLAEAPTEPGPDAPDHPQAFQQVGQVAAGYARLAAAGIPTAGVCFGAPPADTAGIGGFDYTIALRAATGARPAPAGLTDHLAADERDALRLARQCARRFPTAGAGPARGAGAPPKHDPEDLLAVPAGQPREILARVLDGSEFDEVQPGYGEALCAGWGEVHGRPVAVLADAAGAPEAGGASEKAGRVVRLAARTGTPLVFLQHGNGSADRAVAGVFAAAAGAGVPLVSLRVGRWRGAAAAPALARFRFAWPQAGAGLGTFPEICSALELSGRLDDDGIIDPRDTRTVLGLCLAVMGQ